MCKSTALGTNHGQDRHLWAQTMGRIELWGTTMCRKAALALLHSRFRIPAHGLLCALHSPGYGMTARAWVGLWNS